MNSLGDTLHRSHIVRGLLACGAASSGLYVLLDLTAALRYEGYSYLSQTISELSAVGAPTRPLWLIGAFIYEVLVFAFAFGILLASGGRRSLRIVGAITLTYAIVGVVWPFAPMHQREVLAAGGDTRSDTWHLVLAGVDSALFFLMIGFGATSFGLRWRVYSIATIAVLLVAGSYVSARAGGVAEDAETPWLGIAERITVFAAMLWMAMLSLGLVRRHDASNSGASMPGVDASSPRIIPESS